MKSLFSRRVEKAAAKLTNASKAIVESLEGRQLLAATPLTSNTTINASFATTSEIDEYTFSATAGQTIIVTMGRDTGSLVETGFSIYAPNGSLVKTAGSANAVQAYAEYKPTVSGTYTVKARTLDRVGKYNLQYFKLPHTGAITDPADGDGKALTSNSTVAANIDKLGDVDLYTLNATAGQRVVLSLGRDAGTSLELGMSIYNPAGTLLASRGGTNQVSGFYEFVAPTTGNYFVTVRGFDNDIGGYKLHALKLAHTGNITDPADGDGKTLVSNTTVVSTIDNIGDFDLYRFTANAANERVILGSGIANGTTLEQKIVVYGPTGAIVASAGGQNSTSSYLEFLTPSAGAFDVVVYGQDNKTGNYQLHYIKLPDTKVASDPADGQGGSLVSGVTRTASINAKGDVDLYHFYAAVGDKLLINLQPSATNDPIDEVFKIYGPNGAPLSTSSGFQSYSFTATTAGLYNLVVRAEGASAVLPYKLSLALTPNYTSAKSTITIAAEDGQAVEGGLDDGVLRITRNNNRALPLTVEYTITGNAVNGTDYDTITGTVTIPGNSSSVSVNINAKLDSTSDSNETVTLTLKPKSDYILGTTKAASVKIIDGSTIRGAVYNDLNDNGTRDTGEPGLSAWQLYIDKDNDNVYDTGELTVTSDASGNYAFIGVAPGTNVVREVVKSGFRQTSPSTVEYAVVTTVGQTVTGKNFGNTQKARISGNVFNDPNKNGTKDTGETNFSGVKVFLDTDNDGILDTGETTVTTDSSGNYTFKNLTAGSFKVRIVKPTGKTQSTPISNGAHSFSVSAGQIATGKNFGLF